jgi:acetyl esterase
MPIAMNKTVKSHSKEVPDLLHNPRFRAFLQEIDEHEKTMSSLPLSEQRTVDKKFILARTACHESLKRIEDIEIRGMDNHRLPLRIYIPESKEKLPMMIYFHGGGWVFGGIEESDAVCRRLANHLGCVVASVEYRLAPEFPFPKGLEDCYSATLWMKENGFRYSARTDKIIVAGESAGGNLAAAVSFLARERRDIEISLQLLLYPAISSKISDEVYDLCPDHYFLTKEAMRYFWNCYLGENHECPNPLASLDCQKEYRGLPPALIVCGEYDPLNYDIDKYMHLLENAEVKVIHKTFPKLVHGFLYIPLYTEEEKVQWTKDIRECMESLKTIIL